MEEEYELLLQEIIEKESYQQLKKFIHHGKVSTYEHSIAVARLCYEYAKKKKLDIDYKSLIRAALLHDYYLYDWHDKGKWHKPHGYKHPKIALHNAIKDYPDINEIEKDAILRHMFPLTLIPPKYKEGWILQKCDKKATLSDYKKKKEQMTQIFLCSKIYLLISKGELYEYFVS